MLFMKPGAHLVSLPLKGKEDAGGTPAFPGKRAGVKDKFERRRFRYPLDGFGPAEYVQGHSRIRIPVPSFATPEIAVS